jgi:hypothetical protein
MDAAAAAAALRDAGPTAAEAQHKAAAGAGGFANMHAAAAGTAAAWRGVRSKTVATRSC